MRSQWRRATYSTAAAEPRLGRVLVMSAPPKRASLRQGTADAAALPNYVSVGAGAVAGVVELMTMYPLGARAPGGRTHTDVVKTRLQLEQGAAAKGKPHGMLRMMAQIVRQEGCVPYPRAHSVCTSCTEASSLCWYSRRPSVRSSLGRLLWRRCGAPRGCARPRRCSR